MNKDAMDVEAAVLAFTHAPIGLAVTRDRVIERCNARFCETFGYAECELPRRSLALLYPSHEEFLRIGEIGMRRMRATGRYADERIMQRRDGSLFWCRVRGQSLTPETPFERAVWSFADISESRPVVDLTARERQVAALLAEGRTSKEIARTLDLSPRTAEAHRAKLQAKLGARNTAELVARLTGLPM
ncbi:LuxR C-terminal-related transcriptional regulator [uncultured Thioclava sp.]|uniref:LuxR family transcriptional regulator n=1 Tax=uncultured Thioclava sp. TaxID=473858 RepID=UPI0025F2C1DD|nr:LuxR C-terminal-related transcriptional regulator [uncultured Thioclava sp.]